MKARKQHIRAVEVIIQAQTGVKASGWMRYVFSTFKGYNRFVEKKFSGLREYDKKRIMKLVMKAKKDNQKRAR